MGHVTPEYDHRVLEELARKTAGWTAIEVGSWVGSTALTLASHFDQVFCIDTFQGSPGTHLETYAEAANTDEVDGIFRVFCHNVRPHLMAKIFPCVGRSTEWAFSWPYSVDLVFIDADHEYEAVRQDVEAWKPHCHGILCGHDYSRQFPGVVKAVDEAFTPEQLHWKGNVWWVDMRGVTERVEKKEHRARRLGVIEAEEGTIWI